MHQPANESQTPLTPSNHTNSKQCGLDVLDKLKSSVAELNMDASPSDVERPLKKINAILHETDISSFEMIHSGLIEKLLTFLSAFDQEKKCTPRKSGPSFSGTPLSAAKVNTAYLADLNRVMSNEFKVLKVKQFLNVFINLPLTYYVGENVPDDKSKADVAHFSILVSKLQNCVNQLEQYAVRVHDVPNSIGYGKTAIKFFNTHQIKCLLQRHPSAEAPTSAKSSSSITTTSSGLRQWKGGNVKVDPLAVVGTIEKYLLMRGIHKVSSNTVRKHKHC